MRVLTSILATSTLALGVAIVASNSGSAARAATSVPSPAASAAAGASPAASDAASPAAAVAAAAVDTKDFAYAPATLTVAAGTKVTFKNSDTVAHTVTASDKSFDSGNMDQNATWSHVFEKAGTYKYVCAYHAFMKGTIVVK